MTSRKTLVLIAILLALILWAIKASAQEAPPVSVTGSCARLDQAKALGLGKNEKALLELKCELEKAEATRQIREAKQPTFVPLTPDPIGVAAKNAAVTKVTYRNAEGVAISASKEGARHVENLSKNEVRMEKAKRSSGCGFLGLMCPTPVIMYGGGYGGYGYGGYNGYGGGPVYNNSPPPVYQQHGCGPNNEGCYRGYTPPR